MYFIRYLFFDALGITPRLLFPGNNTEAIFTVQIERAGAKTFSSLL